MEYQRIEAESVEGSIAGRRPARAVTPVRIRDM